jgi:hypothetical protein
MISILLTLIVVIVVVGILFYILSLLPVPQPWLNIAKVLVALIVLIWLISYITPIGHPLLWH